MSPTCTLIYPQTKGNQAALRALNRLKLNNLYTKMPNSEILSDLLNTVTKIMCSNSMVNTIYKSEVCPWERSWHPPTVAYSWEN